MKRAAFVVDNVRSAALRALNYEPSVERVRRSCRGRTQIPLRELVADLGSGYATVFARIDCDPAHGVELLSQSDMFAAEPQGRVIRRDSMKRPERHEVRRWQVLIAGAGTLAETELYGRAIIADNRLAGKCAGQDTLIIEFAEPEADISLYAYAFLASPTGFRALRSASYGTKILRIRKDILADLPVPLPADEIVHRVADRVRHCVEQREVYLRELQAARRVIEDLPEMREAHAMCAERKARCVIWDGPLPTFSAWNYASSGAALSLLQKRWSGRLRDTLVPDGVFNGPRFARVDSELPHGIDFLSQRDVFMIRPVPRRTTRPAISDRVLFVPKDAVLAGSHGQLTDGGIFGKVELASFAAHRCGVTQDILRLLFRPEFRSIAYIFLSTMVGQRLLKSTAIGTSIPLMRLDLLMDIPIPELPRASKGRAEAALSAAENARIAADAAEAEAIRIIEEEVLPAWLA